METTNILTLKENKDLLTEHNQRKMQRDKFLIIGK